MILSRRHRDLFKGPCLISDDPYLAFVDACNIFACDRGRPGQFPGASAWIDPTARVGEDVAVGVNSVIDREAALGDSVTVGANCFIGAGVTIGKGTRLASGVNVYPGCSIGEKCNIESGAVIGSPGFGYLETGGEWKTVPQIGSVVIGNRVDIGANTTIDRGTLDDTVIGDGVKLDNQIQVAHNVQIGENTAIAGCTGIAGSARIGRRCKIGGRASILGHLTVGDDVTILATSVVTRSVESGGTYSSNLTVQPAGRWRRILARLALLDELYQRVRRLERRLETKSGGDPS